MKRKLLITLILIMAIPSLALFSQEGQVFSVSVDYPDQGTIGSAGNPVDAHGTITVPVGGYARLFLTGYIGYEPAGFYINGQYSDGGLFEYKVDQVTGPINVVGTFRPVQDAIGPVLEIISPSKSSCVKTGSDNKVSIVCMCNVENETMTPSFELYKNGTLLPDKPVHVQDDTYYRFENLPLGEGDNLFMVRANTSVSYSNYAVDFVLVHYSSVEDVDAVRAVILVDQRLYSQPGIGDKLAQYASFAGPRIADAFLISIEQANGIDDWTPDQVQSYIAGLKRQHKALDGVLLVGNVKLPSFTKPRSDIGQSRLITNKYEDFDLVLRNTQGSQADYDYMEKGANPLPDIWCAVMPVGTDDLAEHNTYEAFAAELNPYLDKLLARYGNWNNNSTFYQLSNQLWDLNCLAFNWGMGAITFNSVNDTGLGPYHWYNDKTADTFYKPMETFRYDVSGMSKYYRSFPWIGEGWQSKDIYMSQMNESEYGIVWTNVHSSESGSVVSTDEAKTLRNGGIIQLASGCSVGGFKQYGSASYSDAAVYPDGNILCGYVYGSSSALVALGCPFDRGHESQFEKLSGFVAQGDYVGKAHFFRKCLQYQLAGSNPDELKMNTQEILIGDPFVKISDEYQWDVTPPSVPQNLVCTSFDSTNISVAWDPSTDDMGLMSYFCQAIDPDGYQMEMYANGNNAFATLSYLDPDTTYTLSAQAMDYWGNRSAWSAPITVTTKSLAGRLPAAQGFTCTGKTDTTLTVSWQPLPPEYNVKLYEVSYKNPQDYVWRWQVWDGSNSATIDGILSNSSYILKIRAVDANWVGGLWSDTITVTTNVAVPPSMPYNLAATPLSEGTLLLSWDPSTDDTGISGYEIQYVNPAGEINGTWSSDSSEEISGLNPNIRYIFKVRATDVSGNSSDWSSALVFTTNPPAPPTVPQNLQAAMLSESSYLLSWDPSTAYTGISGYEIQYAIPTGEIIGTSSSVNSVVINDLNQLTTYTFKVRSIDNSGIYSDWSSPQVFTTFPPAPPTVPQNLTITGITANSVSLAWDPSSAASGINYYIASGIGADGSTYSGGTSDTFITAVGLNSGVAYTFRVSAYDFNGGGSDLSIPVTGTTLGLIPPTTPTNLVAINIGVDNITIGWDPSATNNSISYYIVYCTGLDGSSKNDVSTDTQSTFTGLAPGIEYSFKITACDAYGIHSDYSDIFVISTLPQPPDWTPVPTSDSTLVPTPNSTPIPTPVPPSGIGQVWISPAAQSAIQGANVTIEIHANTGSSLLGAYGFTVTYPTNMFTFGSITEIASGLNLITNFNTAGTIVTAGFNASGIPGSPDLALIRITLTATGSGTGSIDLTVQNLNDVRGGMIGSPSATNGTITISGSGETSAPTAVPTAVPTGGPTIVPTAVPTGVPTIAPTAMPTTAPTPVPTAVPDITPEPTSMPTLPPANTPVPPSTAEPTPGTTPIPSATPKPHSTPRPTHAPLPDLVPIHITVKGNLKPGSPITLASGVTNMGEKESGKFKVTWIMNYSSIIGSGIFENVTAGATVAGGKSSVAWTPKWAGRYVIIFILDPDNKVKESNESNNIVYKTIDIKK